jgi:hypothetical protein
MRNIAAALKIRSILRESGVGAGVKILIKVHSNRGVGGLLESLGETQSDHLPSVVPFGMAEEECNFQTVIAPGREEIAQAMHNKYFEKALKGGAKIGERPALNVWHNLPAHLQNSNRWQFEHLFVKIRLADNRFADPDFSGGDLVKYTAMVSNKEFKGLVEPHKSTLSRMEHNRWSAEKWLTGWEYSPERDDSKKRHSDLLPYDELSGEVRQLDIDTAENMTNWMDIIREHGH